MFPLSAINRPGEALGLLALIGRPLLALAFNRLNGVPIILEMQVFGDADLQELADMRGLLEGLNEVSNRGALGEFQSVRGAKGQELLGNPLEAFQLAPVCTGPREPARRGNGSALLNDLLMTSILQRLLEIVYNPYDPVRQSRACDPDDRL